MGLFDFFKRKSEAEQLSPFEQELAEHGLLEWLRSSFTVEERQKIEVESRRRSRSATPSTPEGTVLLLRAIAPKGALGDRVLEKAETVASESKDQLVLDRFHSALIDRHLSARGADPAATERAIAACRKMIARAAEVKKTLLERGDSTLPRHHGFEQLAILLEKQGAFDEAISVSRRAQDQGWAGDWEQRIDRCERKREAAREVGTEEDREKPVVPEAVHQEEDASSRP